MPAAPEPVCLPSGHWSNEKHFRKAGAQLKVDGIRGLYVHRRALTREALPFRAMTHCLPGLIALEEAYGQPMVFDGEYQEPGGFQDTLAAHKRGEGVGVFWIFDAVPYAEWAKNRFISPLCNRIPPLMEKIEALDNPFIGGLPMWEVNADEAQGMAQDAWDEGYEGLVIKDLYSRYVRGRANIWLKLKREQSVDLVIFDVAESRTGRPVLLGRMGRRVIKVGSNIPDDMAEALLKAPEQFTGTVMEVSFRDTTESGKLKGAYFVRMRPDKEAPRHG